MAKRILQANLNNLGGAFSVVYEAQKKLEGEFVFDYFSSEKFVDNEIYRDLVRLGSECIGNIQCKSRFLKQYEVYRSLLYYLEHKPHEYVHIHSDTAWKMLVYYLAAKKAGVENIIVHSHSSGIAGHYRWINYFLHILCRKIIKKAKYCCACSNVAAIWMFGTTDNVRIIQNGVDTEKYKFNECSRNTVRKQYGISNEIKVIGTVSDFSYPKNPEFIFELIKKLKNNKNYAFLMVGNRESGCLLKDLVDKEKDVDNVIFTGMVTNVEEYLSAMDIFILPSRFEGLPMCAIEAQISGLFTITSDRVTAETECSKYFSRLPLDTEIWVNKVENVDVAYNRNDTNVYLLKKKLTADETAEEFRKIYTEGNRHE